MRGVVGWMPGGGGRAGESRKSERGAKIARHLREDLEEREGSGEIHFM